MITGLVIAPSKPPAGDIPDMHGRLPIDAQPFDLRPCHRLLVFFSILAKMASVSALFFGGLALITWRSRKPRRLSTTAMVLGEGNWSSPYPWVLKASRAAGAVSRVEARVVRHVGSCWAWASATWHRASAASGGVSSQRLRPLQAACAPRHMIPVRRSARPTATVRRPHPQ